MGLIILTTQDILLTRPQSPYDDLVAELFQVGGWQTMVQPPVGNRDAALITSKGRHRYIVNLKVSSNGRRDRLVPLLAQAILEAQARAKASPPTQEVPLAVIAAPHISPRMAVHLQCFRSEYAPDVAVGIVDQKGFRSFVGENLEGLNAPHPRRVRRQQAAQTTQSLFSDLNQWMLKVLLAPLLADNLLTAPRGLYSNPSRLAKDAKVSVMSAFRFVRQLRTAGFINPDATPIKLINTTKLMGCWKTAYRRSAQELPLWWISPPKRDKDSALQSALKSYCAHPDVKCTPAPRLCLGHFSAADQLGFGFVNSQPPSFYLERLDDEVLARLGLSSSSRPGKADVCVRIPAFRESPLRESAYRESVFRAAVPRNGVPVADIIQVWLDIASHTAAGVEEQTRRIENKALAPVFKL